jgi:hypothetical protein
LAVIADRYSYNHEARSNPPTFASPLQLRA